jgi:hypothetical protein
MPVYALCNRIAVCPHTSPEIGFTPGALKRRSVEMFFPCGASFFISWRGQRVLPHSHVALVIRLLYQRSLIVRTTRIH